MVQAKESSHNGNSHRKPCFLITIDAEGDNLWSKPRTVTTRNADFLPRFQLLCESYGLKPTYLANYEMAESPSFREFGRDMLKRGTGEIGMHLHAWNSPPLVPLTKSDHRFHPYLIEYPRHVMEAKIRTMTHTLEDIFGVKMVSHRAGQWVFNETYAQMLIEEGYLVDCSVTPGVSWKGLLGGLSQSVGTDYYRFPEEAYFLDPEDISRAGQSPLLEVPVTILPTKSTVTRFLNHALRTLPLGQIILGRFLKPVYWLRPRRGNQTDLLRLVRRAVDEQRSYVEFMLHSSELMPGGSPTFSEKEHIEALYRDLHVLFNEIRGAFVGATLTDYYSSHLRVGKNKAG